MLTLNLFGNQQRIVPICTFENSKRRAGSDAGKEQGKIPSGFLSESDYCRGLAQGSRLETIN